MNTHESVELAFQAWPLLVRAVPTLPVPEVSAAEGGVIVLLWHEDVRDTTLIFRPGSDVAEWHYHDAGKKERRAGSWRVGVPIPGELAEGLWMCSKP